MAFSQSIGKAQTPAVCQFCEISPEIQWKCINCELFLCNLCCSKIHNKSKASMEHEIINIKDIETVDFAKTMRKVDLQNMQCTIHGKEKCFVYCKDCSEPVCSKCTTEVHQKHEYKALDEVYEGLIADINEVEDKIESNLQFLKKEKNNLLKILSDGDTNFQEIRDIILKTEKEMIEAISKFAENLLQKLEKKWKSSENMIKTELFAMTKKEDELETRKNNINQALQSHHVADIFSTSKTLDTSLPKYSVKQIKQKKSKFIPSNLQVNIGSKMFGGLYTVPDFELIDTYQSDVENVPCILLSSDNAAFIGSYYNKKLLKMKIENHYIKLEKEVLTATFDMSWTVDGEILVSCGENGLKFYTTYVQLKSFQSFSPLKTLGVHVTGDNKIILGLTESSGLPVTKNSIRRIVVMALDGKIQHTIEYDRENKRLLSYPYRINTLNDKVVVVDLINKEHKGRVVMLDYRGQLHWTYNGCNSINSDKVKFHPRDLAITSTDMILVSDSLNHAIHVLNPDGEVIAYKDVKSVGIESPWSLSIDKKDVLWIGCNAWESDKNKKGKIHCVKLL